MTLRNWFLFTYVCRFLDHDWKDVDNRSVKAYGTVVECRRCHSSGTLTGEKATKLSIQPTNA